MEGYICLGLLVKVMGSWPYCFCLAYYATHSKRKAARFMVDRKQQVTEKKGIQDKTCPSDFFRDTLPIIHTSSNYTHFLQLGILFPSLPSFSFFFFLPSLSFILSFSSFLLFLIISFSLSSFLLFLSFFLFPFLHSIPLSLFF